MTKAKTIIAAMFVGVVPLMFPSSAAAGEPLAKAQDGDWPMWGGSSDRNMVSGETGIPSRWNLKTKENIKWIAPLGSPTYGAPVIVGGKVFIGTNNKAGLRKGIKGDKGVMVCLNEKTGTFLWQATHDKLPSGNVNDWAEQGIPSAPYVEGDRLYYVSNRCELVCADVNGFLDGENDGPFKQEKHKDTQDADIVWVLDMFKDLKVFPHNLATCSPVGAGDMIFVSTSNGVDVSHRRIPSPDAPSLIAVDKKSGKVLWQRSDPGKNILHGQWSSPAYGVVQKPKAETKSHHREHGAAFGPSQRIQGFKDSRIEGAGTEIFAPGEEDRGTGVSPAGLRAGRPCHSLVATEGSAVISVVRNERRNVESAIRNPQLSVPLVIFGAGDGWCYAHAAKTGKVVWKFDLNPKDSKWVIGGRGDKSSIIGTPVIYDNKVFLAVGQDPEHGDGIGHLYCIDATKTGDITETGRVWHFGGEDFNRSLSTVAIADGLLYAADLSGFLHCLDVRTGKQHWVHDTFAGIWGSPFVVDGKVLIGTVDGEVLVLKHDKEKKLLATNDVRYSVYATPVAANGVLYIANSGSLIAIEGKKNSSKNCGTGVSPVTKHPRDAGATGMSDATEGLGLDPKKPKTASTSPAAPTVRRAEWPMFRGNPQLTGVASGTLPDRPALLWKFDTGEGVQSSAAIVSGAVFVGCDGGILFALDLANGAVKWRYRTTWTEDSSDDKQVTPTISDGHADARDPSHAGARDPSHADARIPSRTQPADEPGPAILASPCVVEELVFFGDEDGVFHAVDKKSGRARWTFEADAEILSSANHAADRILFGSYDGCLHCLSARDGKLLWKYEIEGPIHATPSIAGNHVIVAGCDAKLHVIRLSDGVQATAMSTGARAAASPAVRGPRLFLGTLGNNVLGIEWATGRRLWTHEHPDRKFPFHASAAVTDRWVVIGGRDKLLHALDPRNGEARWTYRAKARIDSSPVIVQHRVFFGASDGVLYALALESGRETWRFEAGAPIVASPAVCSGHLVIGTEDGIVYCFGKQGGSQAEQNGAGH